MNRGIVMEKHKRFMIVMTNEGEFIKTKVDADVEVGDETTFLPIETPKFSTFYQNKRYVSVMAAAIILLFFLPIYHLFSPDKVYGFVTVDINPSIEFRVNSSYEVIDANSYNNEGSKVLESLDEEFIGQPLNVVVGLLINMGNELGYLSHERDIYISSSLNITKELWGESYDNWMEAIQQDYEVNFITINVDNETLEAAQKLSLSPTKFVLLKDAEKEGKEISVDQVKNRSIEEIEHDTGKEIERIVSPENIQINAPFRKGKPENPGNSNNNNRNDQKKDEKDDRRKSEDKSNEGKGKGNNKGNSTSKDDQHPSEKKSGNAKANSNKKDDHPSSVRENNSQRQNPGQSARQNQAPGNSAKQNPGNGNRQNQGNINRSAQPRNMRK